jgi:hypothetical protein
MLVPGMFPGAHLRSNNMKKTVKKLVLAKETLLSLEAGALDGVVGGVSEIQQCFTQTCADVCDLRTRATCAELPGN